MTPPELPAPDDHEPIGDGATVPVWSPRSLGIQNLIAWPDGLGLDGELIERAEGLDAVERDALKVLAAVAAVRAAWATP